MNPLIAVFDRVGNAVLLLFHAVRYIPSIPRQMDRIMEQCFQMGYRTLFIVALLSLFIGGVLALQSGYSLQNLSGGQSYLGSIVGLSMCRELGPVMTAFLLAGRVGSSITAELASMKVYREVDALITMNIPPERLLVLPRLIATLMMMPILTIFSIIIGWYGGMLVSEYVHFINLEPETYWQGLKDYMDFKSVQDGLIKAEVFGFAVTMICCNEGLLTNGGPREIGSAVTRGVVYSMMAILVLDYFITKLQM